ncbi:hypothetical protein [Comamonas flocculans]|uniref:Response regulator n=1 Tax=Comamonas flocculans TaxID=2597701 RepID=A0A5B8RSZ7_9BURK|nr:hypothetical protein [Comamonas flocculans]QEA12666.1 hypothetical protein FOZ74_06265 [Comamonas flocculans]
MMRASGSPAGRPVAATGWGDQAARTKTAHTGFNYHLTKPINLEELVRILERPVAEIPPVAS